MKDAKDYENHLDKEIPKWFAVYTAFKKEKYAEKLLNRKGIQTYLPIQTSVKQYTRKVKTVHKPLISCYIFVKITAAEYVQVLETEYIFKFVKFSKNLLSIPQVEIDLLQNILGEKIPVSAEQVDLRSGDDIEITSGNLIGLRGKLIELKGKEQVVIELKNIGYSLVMEMERTFIKRLNRAAY